jgi:hypothetical protein
MASTSAAMEIKRELQRSELQRSEPQRSELQRSEFELRLGFRCPGSIDQADNCANHKLWKG